MQREKLFSKIKQNESALKKYLLITLFLLIPVLFFTDYIISLLLIASTFLTALFVKHSGLKSLGIELMTLATVLHATQYGPAAGAATGFFLVLAHFIVGGFTGPFITWVLPGYAVMGAAAAMVSMPILQLGMAAVLSLNAFFFAMTYIVSPGRIGVFAPYMATNILFNYVLFKYLAPVLLNIM